MEKILSFSEYLKLNEDGDGGGAVGDIIDADFAGVAQDGRLVEGEVQRSVVANPGGGIGRGQRND